jgi:signal transduction histidine kinase/CheY-like chemotaxis protein/HAMP domain-containing protein
MRPFSSLRVRLVGTVLLAIMPAWLLMYCTALPWTGFMVGLFALVAAWYGGERFILRQVRALVRAARRLGDGDLSSRTGLGSERGEIGELARTFDSMATALEQRVEERERGEKTLLNRSLQQTVVGALGQFAMASGDFSALLNQVVMLVAQTLEVEYCSLFELMPNGQFLTLRSGVGWTVESLGDVIVPTDPATQSGFTLTAGEPVVVEALPKETRFRPISFFVDHGVISEVTALITGHERPFGIIGAHTTHRRKFTEDEVQFLLSVGSVVAMAVERQRAEAELQKLAAFAQLNPNPAMEVAPDGNITYFNDAALKLALDVGQDHPRGLLPPNVGDIVHGCLDELHHTFRCETRVGERTLSWSFHPVQGSPSVHCYIEDITERLDLEAQLRHSQKLESVGQLAAGVAHDFNNMLTVIQGHSGMLLAKTAHNPELHDPVQAVFFAAERAAGLTRQLLMFSRKNIIQPCLLDVRELVANMSKMLQRLLGETIALEFHPPASMPLIQADAGMVEQILMNLAVNARDAMPKGGRLAIATTPVEISEDYARMHPDARAGLFVCLRVGDTGCGMDADVVARIFEPFFTTKEVGKGTGLGLATVYGIVKQHEGWIEVASEPEQGTTFSVYLPATAQPAEAALADASPTIHVRGGSETILVVEDEPVLRDMAHVILEDAGYQVLEAKSGVEALEVWNHYPEKIDLLLTDMVMPEGISGMDLALRLLAAKPELKVVFASGYTMDDMNTDFVREGHATFLQKPYTHLSLAKAVRDCLDDQPAASRVK